MEEVVFRLEELLFPSIADVAVLSVAVNDEAVRMDAQQARVGTWQNDDMRRISAWAAIFAIPTMVAGVYGMNFEDMPELGWSYGYPLALGLMALASGLLYRAFRRNGWL
ncbi:CorA family divalent cation transporter [Streptomyces clavifer]|uniref:CorA family divalent cation transporter n=1 Tax=Streptomyces clavifer TaxID=68188 RepID=UPI0037FE0184